MQAPTNPGGPPAHEPGERTCPGCGASNGPLAAFCWQCYRQFGPLGGTGVVSRPGVVLRPGFPAPEPAPVPFPASRTVGAGRLAGVMSIALALVVAGGVYFLMNRGSAAELPSSFGGVTRIEDEQLEAVLDLARTQVDDQGIETDMGVYGAGAFPTAALAWVAAEGQTLGGDPFGEFALGFDSSFGAGTIDRSRTTSQVSDGVTIMCAPVVGSTPSNLCLWQQEDVVWVLVDFSGSRMPATQTLAVAANAAA